MGLSGIEVGLSAIGVWFLRYRGGSFGFRGGLTGGSHFYGTGDRLSFL